MNQAKFDKAIFNMLTGFQDMSNCTGSHVAACLIDGDRIVSQGWNGTPRGMVNCNDIFTPVENGAWIVPLLNDIKEWLIDYVRINMPASLDEYVQGLNNPEAKSVTVNQELKDYLHGKWSEKYEIHAEMNMLFNTMRQQADISDISKCVVYITHSPCAQCMKNLAALGIKHIKYREVYWRDSLENINKSAELFNMELEQVRL